MIRLGMLGLAVFAGLAVSCAPQPLTHLADLPPFDPLDELPVPHVPAPPVEVLLHRPAPRVSSGPDVPAEWIPEGKRPWRFIVVHHSATERGDAAIFDAMHRGRGWDELGYHFVIPNGCDAADGCVQVGSRWAGQKWGAHTGGTPDNEYNDYGIGVCVVGDFRRRLPSEKQLASLHKLVRYLAERYGIPPERVIGHRDAPGARTECPGDALHAYVHGKLRGVLRAKAPVASSVER